MRIYKPGNYDYTKVWFPEGKYNAEICGISNVIYSEQDKKEKESIIFFHNVNVKKQYFTLPQFLNAIVSKGSKDFKNSSLYDILDLSGMKEDFFNKYEEVKDVNIDKWAIEYFKNNLLKKHCDVQVKTIKKDTPDKYSIVNKILRFG